MESELIVPPVAQMKADLSLISKDKPEYIKKLAEVEKNFMIALNLEPDPKWLVPYPPEMGINGSYIPVNRIKWLLHRIYTRWWEEVIETKIMANSVACTIRLYVVNPITGEIEHTDGVGSFDIQTERGASAMDVGKTKPMSVMKALPASKSMAIKDAAEEFGKIFGRDLNAKNPIDYVGLLKVSNEDELATLVAMLEVKKPLLSPEKLKRYQEIIDNKESGSYKKMKKELEIL